MDLRQGIKENILSNIFRCLEIFGHFPAIRAIRIREEDHRLPAVSYFHGFIEWNLFKLLCRYLVSSFQGQVFTIFIQYLAEDKQNRVGIEVNDVPAALKLVKAGYRSLPDIGNLKVGKSLLEYIHRLGIGHILLCLVCRSDNTRISQ